MPYKFTNCIYILKHPTAYLVDNIQTYKVGSTKNLPERMLSYKTYYPIDKIVIAYFYIKNYNCYDLDNDIKKFFNNDNIKSSVYNGGIEFYVDMSIEKLTIFFNSVNIEYELYLDNDYEKYYIYKHISEIETPFSIIINYKLKPWQQKLVYNFDKFISCKSVTSLLMSVNNNNTGIIIAPTGCGKSFMISYLSIFHYITLYKNDVLIMTKRKEIFDSDFIKKTNEMIIDSKQNIKVHDLINIKNDYTIFENNLQNNIFIINTDKFTKSNNFMNYKNYSFGNIKLLILDESHWAGANQFNEFLEYIKSINIKIIGFSATPIRTNQENIIKTLNIFTNSNNESVNIIYSRSYIESIEENDRVKTKWLIIPLGREALSSADPHTPINKTCLNNCDIIDENNKITNILNNSGIDIFLKWFNKFIIKSLNKKGIFWFANIKSLLQFYKYNKSSYNNITNIIFYPTYSTTNNNNNIKKFKNENKNSILLAVYRGTEGFDDTTIDFGFNLYVCNNSNPLLDQQKEGRVSRTTFINSDGQIKKVGYYGFLTNIDNEEYKNILIKRLGDWINYIKEFENYSNNNNLIKYTTNNYIDMIIDKTDIIIDENNIKEINYEDIKTGIYKYSEKLNNMMDLISIKRHMHKYNNYILKKIETNSLQLIDTKEKYIEYANKYDMPIDIIPDNYNWIKFLRPDYNELIKKYYNIDEFIDNIKNNNFESVNDIINYIKINDNNLYPSYDYINNGFYDKNINFTNLLNYNNDLFV